MKFHWRSLTSALLGALAVGGFHPFELWFFPLVSLIALIWVVRGLPFRHRAVLFYLYGAGFLLPLLHWSSTYVGSLPWLILALGFAGFYMIVALGFTNGRVSPIFFASSFSLAESLRAIAPFSGFGWGRFGFSQLDGPFQNWLRIGGVALAGFTLALVAALLAEWQRRSLLVAPLIAVGALLPISANAASTADVARVGLIQGGVSQLGLDFNATPQEVFDRHFTETEKLLDSEDRIDLIIWPENASDVDPIRTSALRERLDSLTSRTGVPLIIGAVTQSEAGPENVSLMFDGEDGVVSKYQKRDLVPFGEYIPLRAIASRLSSLTDSVRDFVPGESIQIHNHEGLNFAPMICYEILDDRVAWENIKRSNIGVVQTNNATFGRSWQSGQQFQMTRVRAYELRTPFVVAATTGDTAAIDTEGKVTASITKFESGSLVVDVAPVEPTLPPISPEFLLVLNTLLAVLLAGRQLLSRKNSWERTRL